MATSLTCKEVQAIVKAINDCHRETGYPPRMVVASTDVIRVLQDIRLNPPATISAEPWPLGTNLAAGRPSDILIAGVPIVEEPELAPNTIAAIRFNPYRHPLPR